MSAATVKTREEECVEACEGVATEELSKGRMLRDEDSIAGLELLRDQLLDAVNDAIAELAGKKISASLWAKLNAASAAGHEQRRLDKRIIAAVFGVQP